MDENRVNLPNDELDLPKLLKPSIYRAAETDADDQQHGGDPAAESGDDSDEESSCCPVCFEPWSSSGKHRIVSLRCGHLFGKSCIEKWLSHQSNGAAGCAKCPQCNAPARRSDIRVLFVAHRKLVAQEDDGREESLMRQLEEEKKNKKIALEREASLRQQLQVARAEIIRLKEEIAKFKLEKLSGSKTPLKFTFWKQLNFFATDSEDSACRSLCIDSHYRTAVLCRGSNVVRASIDASGQTTIFSHSKPVKAVACGFFRDGLVATVGLDCRIKLGSLQSGLLLAEWGLPVPAWSLTFDRQDRNLIYVGLSNRKISIFDVRNTREPLRENLLVDSGQPPLPIHSLCMVNLTREDGDAEMARRALVGATMKGIFLSECIFSPSSDPLIIKTVSLGVTGLCSGLSICPKGKYLTAIFRQPEPSEPAHLAVFSVEPLDSDEAVSDDVKLEVKVHARFKAASGCTRLQHPAMFYGSTLDDPNQIMVALIDEASRSVHLWSVDIDGGSTQLRDSIVCGYAQNQKTINSVAHADGLMGCLSEQQLFLFRST